MAEPLDKSRFYGFLGSCIFLNELRVVLNDHVEDEGFFDAGHPGDCQELVRRIHEELSELRKLHIGSDPELMNVYFFEDILPVRRMVQFSKLEVLRIPQQLLLIPKQHPTNPNPRPPSSILPCDRQVLEITHVSELAFVFLECLSQEREYFSYMSKVVLHYDRSTALKYWSPYGEASLLKFWNSHPVIPKLHQMHIQAYITNDFTYLQDHSSCADEYERAALELERYAESFGITIPASVRPTTNLRSTWSITEDDALSTTSPITPFIGFMNAPVEVREIIWQYLMQNQRHLVNRERGKWARYFVDPVEIRELRRAWNNVSGPNFLPPLCRISVVLKDEIIGVYLRNSMFMVASFEDNRLLDGLLQPVKKGYESVRSIHFAFFD
ncbi:hypothetical protein FB567DRAFT_577405 [Paraphoma chrysanthemicola]|uniref:Uncharacterized protein n=1 Tax=Paraphoma chrysanthemicola TaxID=798071 RepID=A0A8K0W289_9PLEO|nr:hypothetical protein FB567DRAFT_577405 [Paraphoma chrysanthemicola]